MSIQKDGVQMGYLQVNTRAFRKEYVNKDQQKGGELCQNISKVTWNLFTNDKSKKGRLKYVSGINFNEWKIA